MKAVEALDTSPAGSAFLSWERATRSWYPVGPGRRFPKGKIRALRFLGHDVVVYRTASGSLHALPSQCPHLGAHLKHGSVVGEGVRCAMHKWVITENDFSKAACATGSKAGSEDRRPVFRVVERFGLVWIHNGPTPEFALPGEELGAGFWRLTLPAISLRCHPHTATSNGFDVVHFETLHGIKHLAKPEVETLAPNGLRINFRGRPMSKLVMFLTGSRVTPIVSSFAAWGGNVSLTTLRSPAEFHLLIAGTPDQTAKTTRSYTVLFLPKWRPLALWRAVHLIRLLLRADQRVLEDYDMRPDFTPADSALKRFADVVAIMPSE